MGMFDDALAWLDNKRRVAGRNTSDLLNNPRDTIPMIAERAGETLIDHFKDPMNFVGGGMGITRQMAPKEFLRLAAPFGVGGSRQVSRETVDYFKNKGDVSGAYLTTKESPDGLQVGLHDGRHRAIAAEEMGVPFFVDVRKGQRMLRDHPELSEEGLMDLIQKQGGLRPEYAVSRRPMSDRLNIFRDTTDEGQLFRDTTR